MTFFYDLNKKLDEIRATPSTTHGQLNERDMSRAAKALDPVRNKYDKYDNKSVDENILGQLRDRGNVATGQKQQDRKNFDTNTGAPLKANSAISGIRARMQNKVQEGPIDAIKKVGSAVKKVGGKVLDKLGHGDDADMIRDLQRKMGVAQTGEKPKQVKEKMNPAKQKSFAALAPPTNKITFADKIAGAKKEVDEMLGDVAAEAIKSALTPKQKKLDKNDNGKLDANDFAMLRKGGNKKSAEDDKEDLNPFTNWKKPRADRPKVGDVEHGSKHDIKHTSTGRVVTRRTDDQGNSVGSDTDDEGNQHKKRKPGRPDGQGPGKRIGAKVNSGKSKLMTKEGGAESSELKAAMMLLKKAGYKVSKGEQELDEKAVSKKQQKFMGMVHATQKGEKAPSKEVGKVAKTMKKGDAEDFASTKHKGLPEKAPKKKEKTEEAGGSGTPTASSGFSYGQGIYDSLSRELEDMIAESMNISMNMSNDAHGGPTKSLTVTATEDDAMKLSDLLKNAGLGGGEYPNVEGGADLDHPGAIEVSGTMDADGAEDLADQIRQAVDGDHGHEGEETCDACGQADCGCEEMDEAAVNVSQNSPDYPTNTETAQDSFEYSGGLNGPKSTGQTTIPVIAGQEERMGEDDLSRLREMAGIKEAKKVDEDDVEEGNKFTGNLAKARADGKKEADLDGDGDMEKVKESVQDLKRLWSQFKG